MPSSTALGFSERKDPRGSAGITRRVVCDLAASRARRPAARAGIAPQDPCPWFCETSCPTLSCRNDDNLAREATRRRDAGRTMPPKLGAIEQRLRQLEDERDQLIAALSGTPGSSAMNVSPDRAALRARLTELNFDIERLSSETPGVTGDTSTSDEVAEV